MRDMQRYIKRKDIEVYKDTVEYKGNDIEVYKDTVEYKGKDTEAYRDTVEYKGRMQSYKRIQWNIKEGYRCI